MKKITGIYKITNLTNQKVYIGLSKNCLRRWYEHRSKAFTSTKKEDLEKPLYHAFRKYGLKNFSFEIVEECEESLLSEREIFFIKQYDSYNKGYNANHGGDLGPTSEQVLKGEKHGKAKLLEEDVIYCRIAYKEGKRCKDIWNEKYSSEIKFSGFQNMWHGRTWKHIMPEVFENNPHPSKKMNSELIAEILAFYKKVGNYNETAAFFKGRAGYGTVYSICKTNGERTYSERK